MRSTSGKLQNDYGVMKKGEKQRAFELPKKKNDHLTSPSFEMTKDIFFKPGKFYHL